MFTYMLVLLSLSTNESNRYYMALYRKMVDPSLKTSAKQAQFLNLLFKSMKCDLCDNRVKVRVN